MRTKSGMTKRKTTPASELPTVLKLKHSYRRFLKKPFGRLCTKKTALAAAFSAPFTVSVGDATTSFFLSNSLLPSIAVVDFLEKRFPTSAGSNNRILSAGFNEIFFARNPPGTLSQGALMAVKEAALFAGKKISGKKGGKINDEISNKKAARKALVIIEGEEDLVFLAAVLHAPLGAKLFYGQPNKGIVMLESTRDAKERVERLLGEGFI